MNISIFMENRAQNDHYAMCQLAQIAGASIVAADSSAN